MAARLNPRNQESVRQKIKATQLLNRLTNHALGKLKKPMDSTQVSAALGVLKKSLPDLTASDLRVEGKLTLEQLLGGGK